MALRLLLEVPMRLAPWLALVCIACRGGVPGDGDCASHKDASSCRGDTRCEVAGCTDCDGNLGLVACYENGSPPPMVNCPGIACAPPCGTVSTATECAA